MSKPLDITNRTIQQPLSRQGSVPSTVPSTLASTPTSASVSFAYGPSKDSRSQDVTAFNPLSALHFSGTVEKLTPVQFTEAQVKELAAQIEDIEGKDQARIFLYQRLKELKAVNQYLANVSEGQKGLRQLIEKHQSRLLEEIQTVQPEGSSLPVTALLGEVESSPSKQVKADLASIQELNGEKQQEAFAKIIEGASGDQSIDLIGLFKLQDIKALPLPPVDPKKDGGLVANIQGSKPLGLSGSYWYGVMTKGEDGKIKVTSPNPELQQWAKIINTVGLSQEALDQIPEGGIPLVFQVRGGIEAQAVEGKKGLFDSIKSGIDHYNPLSPEHDTPDLLKAFIGGHIEPVYSAEVEHKPGIFDKLKDSVPFLKGKTEEADAAGKEEESEGPSFTMWPFLEGVLNRTKPNLKEGDAAQVREKLATYGDTLQVFEHGEANKLATQLQYLPVGQVFAGSKDATTLQKELKALGAPFQTDLAAYTLGETHYLAPKAEHKAYIPMGLGMVAGFAGETAVEKFVPEGAGIAKYVRMGILFLVDLIDNFLGQSGMVMSRLRPGDNAAGEWAKAGVSAAGGASLGFLTAYPRAFVLSEGHVTPEARALVGGVGSLGTAMAVPLNLRATLTKNAKMVEKLIEKGVIPHEKGKKIHAQALDIALKDMMTEVGSASSILAFYGVPVISGLIMEAERFGIPRTWTQKLFMSVAPAMENILTAAIMLQQGGTFDPVLKLFGNSIQSIETKKVQLRNHILTSNAEGNSQLDQKVLEGNFGNKTAEFLTRMTVGSSWGPVLGILGLAGMYGYVLKKGAFGPKTHMAENGTERPVGEGMPAAANLNPTAVPLQLTVNGLTPHQGIHQFLSARASGVGERPTFATMVSPSIESGSRMTSSTGSAYGAFPVASRPVVVQPPVSASQLRNTAPQG